MKTLLEIIDTNGEEDIISKVIDMEISQKKTCNGCLAFNTTFGKCQLLYKVSFGKPLEPCPKPKNTVDYLKCFDKRNENPKVH